MPQTVSHPSQLSARQSSDTHEHFRGFQAASSSAENLVTGKLSVSTQWHLTFLFQYYVPYFYCVCLCVYIQMSKSLFLPFLSMMCNRVALPYPLKTMVILLQVILAQVCKNFHMHGLDMGYMLPLFQINLFVAFFRLFLGLLQ